MILDTCFLIDQERRRFDAAAFFSNHAAEQAFLSVAIIGEFFAGLSEERLPVVRRRLAEFDVLPITELVAENYARLYRHLRSTGGMIGANDLWNAATALSYDMPLVTRNRAEFSRVPHIRIIDY